MIQPPSSTAAAVSVGEASLAAAAATSNQDSAMATAVASAAPTQLSRQGERVSLTIRQVLKVHKGLTGVLGPKR
jgi:hypothetical protein